MFFTSWQLKAVSITFTLSIILDSELPSDSWNISPHGPMAPGTPEQASGHTGWIPCLADRRIDCMIAPARRQACSSTIGWWEVHARIWISRVGLSIAHWARTWIMGIHDLDPSRIPTLHCSSHTALDKDPAYHVGSSWIFVHIYGWPDPFIFVICFYLRLISLRNPKPATVVFFCMRLEKILLPHRYGCTLRFWQVIARDWIGVSHRDFDECVHPLHSIHI